MVVRKTNCSLLARWHCWLAVMVDLACLSTASRCLVCTKKHSMLAINRPKICYELFEGGTILDPSQL